MNNNKNIYPKMNAYLQRDTVYSSMV